MSQLDLNGKPTHPPIKELHKKLSEIFKDWYLKRGVNLTGLPYYWKAQDTKMIAQITTQIVYMLKGRGKVQESKDWVYITKCFKWILKQLEGTWMEQGATPGLINKHFNSILDTALNAQPKGQFKVDTNPNYWRKFEGEMWIKFKQFMSQNGYQYNANRNTFSKAGKGIERSLRAIGPGDQMGQKRA